MGQKMFIPVTDEILYERPELITSPLRPFQIDHPCFRWLSTEVEAVDPASVDIDSSVEISLSATARRFAPLAPVTPVEPADRDQRQINNCNKCSVSNDGVAEAADRNFRQLLRKELAVSCKDAA